MVTIDSREFRNALGNFATGVTIVTCLDGEGNKVGMTANSFSSLSLTPPLVLWSIAKTSSNFGNFEQAEHFNIHILSAAQQGLANQFASKNVDRFADVELEHSSNPAPALSGCLSRFECSVEHRYEGGDHIILVGRLEHLQNQGGEPLLFSQGKYRHLETL